MIRCAPEVRAKWWRARQLARRVAGEKLPPWACMEAVVGEVLSALPLEPASQASIPIATPDPTPVDAVDGPAGEAAHESPRGRAGDRSFAPAGGCAVREPCDLPPSPMPDFLRPLLDDVDAADAFELDARLRRAVVLEQRLWAKAAPLLREVATRRLHLARGWTTLESWARERLGISPRKTRALLRLERTAARCPELLAAFRAGHLSWVQSHALVPIVLVEASRPWRAGWVAWAARVSVRRLEDDVERALALDAFAPPAERQTGAWPREVEEPPVAETARFFFPAPRDVARLLRATLCTVRRHLERRTGRCPTEGDAVEAMLDHALAAWEESTAVHSSLRRAHRVFERDGWRCTVPGCSSYRNLQDHHVRFRSAGGGDELENRTTLCAWHHLRGVHAGTVRCSGRAPAALRFELGVRGGGRPPLAVYTAAEVRMSG